MALTKIKLNTMVTGTLPDANIPDDITIDTAAAVPASGLTGNTLASGVTASSLTSVGTLTTLQVGGQNSTPKLEWFYDHSNGNDYKANISLAGNDLEVRGSNGTMEFYTGAVDGASSTLALSINSSQNATFAGDVSLTKDGARLFVNSADYELVSIGRAGSSGSALDQGYLRMKSGGTNKIAFHTAGDSYITGGNVGIGTSSPTTHYEKALHIHEGSGSSAIHMTNNTTGTTSDDGTDIIAYQDDFYIWNRESGGHAIIGTNATERMRIASDGKVGIGDDSPDALLSIKGDSDGGTTPSIRLKDGSDTREAWLSNYSGDLVIANGGNDNTPHCKIQMYDGNLMTFNTANTERMRITSSGNVGVNETNPAAKFDIDGDILIRNANALQLNHTSGASDTYINSPANNEMAFRTGGTERMKIESDGTVVMAGAFQPAGRITVNNGSSSSSSELVLQNSGSTGWTGANISLLYNGTSANRGQGIYYHSTASDKEWYTGTLYSVDNDRWSVAFESRASHHQDVAEAAHEIFYIGTAGQVWSKSGYYNTYNSAVNHALSSYTNELNLNHSWPSGQGRIHFNYRASNTHTDFTFYNGSSGGHPDIEAGSFTTTSDYRMKKSVANFTDNVCDKIKLLRPVTYNWKANTKMTEAKQIGFLAHELQEQLPLAVKGEKDAMSEKDNTKIAPQSIKGEALSSYIMKALQEIITRLEVLENA